MLELKDLFPRLKDGLAVATLGLQRKCEVVHVGQHGMMLRAKHPRTRPHHLHVQLFDLLPPESALGTLPNKELRRNMVEFENESPSWKKNIESSDLVARTTSTM